jgi:predicted nuclease with RNAse H fold
MITAGVDLSASPPKTAIASVAWVDGEGARLLTLREHADDEDIVDAVRSADKTGIDCPLGWPVPFVDFLNRHDRGLVSPYEFRTTELRRSIAYRRTDLVLNRSGYRPLSVSADRIAHAAMRAAGILAALENDGHDVDRAGRGAVVEVYPAAALQSWGLAWTVYKGASHAEHRRQLVDALLAAAPWFELSELDAGRLRHSDDAFDAVIAALVARAAAVGAVGEPGPSDAELAAREGWIAIPAGPLNDLLRVDPARSQNRN